MQFFLLARVLDYLLYNVEIHERFAAEKVKLEVAAVSGLLDKKIYRLFACFKVHQRSALAVIALAREAVFTAQVAVLSYKQAHSLYRRSDRRKGVLLIIVLREQDLILIKRIKLGITLTQISRRILAA